ncbi:hypothetical protein ACFFKU_18095 [Kineococcus gynurae]|uniref:Membrane protein YqaA with SNARE-associated domain n=1 Tax=Kineococcus gynurae TaxID=452979 RepID=A0ABV5LNF2_9ACTN
MPALDVTLALAGTTGLAFVSAAVPVVNAEALTLAGAAATPGGVHPALVVLAVTLGQTLGKVALFLVARSGSVVWARRLRLDRHRHPVQRRPRHWPPVVARPVRFVKDWTVRALDSPVATAPLVLVSAVFGIPPLLVVTVALGVRGRGLRVFVPCCFAGRLVRFGLLAASVTAVF